MPEVVIKYKKPETLKILKGLAKYFDFTLSLTNKNLGKIKNNSGGVESNKANDKLQSILIPGNPSIDITELKELFSGKNISAKQLRKEAWEGKK